LGVTAIIDYGMGNLDSVARAVEVCGGTPAVTRSKDDIGSATHIILPGVGSFSDGMSNMHALSLPEMLKEQVFEKGIPFLGICLGMQLLAANGFEGGKTKGLGWLDGEVIRLEPDSKETRIPHIGWNEVIFTGPNPLFGGIPSGKDFYFVHSYHLVCKKSEDIAATTPYCGGFISAVRRENIYGVQFHPEKSQRLGLQVLRNFLEVGRSG